MITQGHSRGAASIEDLTMKSNNKKAFLKRAVLDTGKGQ